MSERCRKILFGVLLVSVLSITSVMTVGGYAQTPSIYTFFIGKTPVVLFETEEGVVGYVGVDRYEGSVVSVNGGYYFDLYLSNSKKRQAHLEVADLSGSVGYVWRFFSFDENQHMYVVDRIKQANTELIGLIKRDIRQHQNQILSLQSAGDATLHDEMYIESGWKFIDGKVTTDTEGSVCFYNSFFPMCKTVQFHTPIKFMPILAFGGTYGAGLAVFWDKYMMTEDWKEKGGTSVDGAGIRKAELTITIQRSDGKQLNVSWDSSRNDKVYFNPPEQSSNFSGKTVVLITGLTSSMVSHELVKFTDTLGKVLSPLMPWLDSIKGVHWWVQDGSMHVKIDVPYPLYISLSSVPKGVTWYQWTGKDIVPTGPFFPLYASYVSQISPGYVHIAGTIWIHANATMGEGLNTIYGDVSFPIPVDITYKVVEP